MNETGTQALLERWRLAQRETIGVDPDAIAYLDVVERMERARAAYREQVDEADVLVEERRSTLVGVAAELL